MSRYKTIQSIEAPDAQHDNTTLMVDDTYGIRVGMVEGRLVLQKKVNYEEGEEILYGPDIQTEEYTKRKRDTPPEPSEESKLKFAEILRLIEELVDKEDYPVSFYIATFPEMPTHSRISIFHTQGQDLSSAVGLYAIQRILSEMNIEGLMDYIVALTELHDRMMEVAKKRAMERGWDGTTPLNTSDFAPVLMRLKEEQDKQQQEGEVA